MLWCYVDVVADVSGLNSVHEQGAWIEDSLPQGVWKWFVKPLPPSTSDCIVERVTVGSTSACHTILSPRRLPGRSRPGTPHVGTISCPLLPTCSDCTLRMIDLASNTARRPACGFHANDEAPLKLA
ncbi:hypothetical protein AVEN_226957-1 [Araneus ventricosus]|uniref:Uncharacterized protein n=1 Tax=Araneus ventricosus TaxID=182803 RepID=A0A4Y2LG76_ARAVE|nr:hypothetical protein AVEN_226957-1 [Araneus ventricosus]